MSRRAAVRSFAVCCLSVCSLTPSHAADFEDGVPLDVVTMLTGGTVTDELPAEVPSFALPTGVDIAGVIDRQVYIQAALVSTLSIDEAMGALNDALMATGWMSMPSFNQQQPAAGFVTAQTPQASPSSIELCRDDFGTAAITQSLFSSAGLMLSFSRSRLQDPLFSCAARIQQIQQSGAMRFGNRPILQYVPRLELPEENSASQTPPFPFMGGNFSGSNTEVETSATTAAALDLPALLTHFGGQLRDQGWVAEFESSGPTTAQSNWTREAGGFQLSGMLSIVRLAENNHRLKFTLLSLQAAGVAAPIVQSVQSF